MKLEQIARAVLWIVIAVAVILMTIHGGWWHFGGPSPPAWYPNG